MLLALAGLIALAYLPGALLYRLPIADRPRRAALPADERAFWAVILSCTITTLAALALAAAGAYTFQRLLAADIALAAVLLVTVRGRLGYGSTAAPLSWTLLLPAALAAVGLYLFFPPSEYIMGGKDPGTYINEGIRLGQQGSLTIHDATLAAVPEEFRGMFLAGDPAEIDEGLHQGVRFMGFFVTNRSRGDVIGQFPHGFPIWIAVGYGLDGLTGARRAVGAWALLGLLAVYFAGARLAGRAPAFIGTLLLGINVAVVWYARYPELRGDAAGSAVCGAAGACPRLSRRRPVLRSRRRGPARLAHVRAAGFAGHPGRRRRGSPARRRRREETGPGLPGAPGCAPRRGRGVFRRAPAGVLRHSHRADAGRSGTGGRARGDGARGCRDSPRPRRLAGADRGDAAMGAAGARRRHRDRGLLRLLPP